MQKLKLLLAVIATAFIVAVTYFLFEAAVHQSTHYVWDTIFQSETYRLLVVPLALVLSLVFFASQHLLDPGSKDHESHSLGGDPVKPSLKSLGIVLLVGFFSLLAGASLGPEAILVPSSVIIGSYLGFRLLKAEKLGTGALVAAAIMALFAAFFHSFIVGFLSLAIVIRQFKTKVTPELILIAIVASFTSYYTLKLIDPTNTYFQFPHITWQVALIDILAGALLMVAGYLCTFALKYAHTAIAKFRHHQALATWWRLGIVAGLGLGIIYLVGGPLVEFTGNQSIVPMLSQAAALGLFGLVGILIVKLIAIAWSRAMGYRGGLIFPMVFVASVLVAIVQLYFKQANFGVGLIAALVGIFAAEGKAKILL